MNTFCTDIKKQTLLVEGIPYANWEVEMLLMNLPAEGFRRELFTFLSEWFYTENDRICVHTSGSTGTPKELWVEKTRMMASACLTCSFLGLRANDSALLCMPLKYIAGKMVVVRALVAGLNLWPVPPSGHPLANLSQAPVFAAMTPMQVYNSLQVPEEKERLQQIQHLIIGGGAIDAALARQLHDFPHAVWSTYGMTETLSHIALRRLNGPQASDWYTPFNDVSIRLSAEHTLIIQAPRVCADELFTNDIAEIDGQQRFRIIGRKDNVINSGGVKIQIEEIEAALKPHLHHPFAITSAPHPKFGEQVVLLMEGEVSSELEALCKQVLPGYGCPKHILSIPRIPLTETGKPDRAKAKLLAAQCLQ